MKMKKFNALMFGAMACAAMLAASCSKDDNKNDTLGKVPVSVTWTQYQGDGTTFERAGKEEYAYTAGKLATITSYGIDEDGTVRVFGVTTYIYGSNGNLTKTNYVSSDDDYSSVVDITYPNATTVQMVYTQSYDGKIQRIDTALYQVNAKGQLENDGYATYTYNADGSLAMRAHTGIDEQETNTYEYDGKNGIYKNWDLPVWYMLDDYAYNYAQNVTRRTEISTHPMWGFTYSCTYALVYDTDDYPTKITETRDGKVQEVKTIVYNK
jgi:outer membrane murein-binding lipoprotein Lpp